MQHCDWSSDVCSSDLCFHAASLCAHRRDRQLYRLHRRRLRAECVHHLAGQRSAAARRAAVPARKRKKTGRITNASNSPSALHRGGGVFTHLILHSTQKFDQSFTEPCFRILDSGDILMTVDEMSNKSKRRSRPTNSTCRSSSTSATRSEERRVGKECRSRWSPYH